MSNVGGEVRVRATTLAERHLRPLRETVPYWRTRSQLLIARRKLPCCKKRQLSIRGRGSGQNPAGTMHELAWDPNSR
jgi:hypothetical protein